MKKKKLQKTIEEPDTNPSISDSVDLLRIYNSVPTSIVVFDAKDNSVKLNRKFTETFGFSETDIQDVDDWWNLSIHDKEQRKSLKIEWNKRFKFLENNNQFEPMEMEVYCKDGSTKYIKYNLEIIEHLYIGSFEDFTDWKLMEQKLKASETRARALINAPDTPIVLLDTKGVLLDINEAAIRTTQINPDKLIGKNVFSLLRKYGVFNTYKWEEVLQKKQSIKFTDTFVGSLWEIEYFPLFNEQNELEQISLFARDITEEKKLKDTEINFRAFMEHGPFLAYIKDKSGKYVYGNPAVHEFVKSYSDNEFVGSSVGTFFDENTSEEMIAYDKEIIEKKQPIAIPPHSRTDKKGKKEWMKEIKFPIPISDKETLIGGIVLFVTDEVRLREQLEEHIIKLKENEKRLQLTQFSVDNSSMPIMIFNEQGSMIYGNQVAFETLGYESKDISSLSIKDIQAHETSGKHSFREGIKIMGKRSGETQIKRKNGILFPALATINSLDLHGDLYLIMFLQDITLQKRNEMELNKLFNATEQSPISIVITGVNGMIEYVNPKFCDLTGFRHEELIGKNPRVLKSGYTTREEYTNLYETIKNGDIWKGVFRNIKKNGDFFWENATISPIFGSNGEIQYFLGLKEDITEKITLQEQLQHSQKMEAMGRLAGGISHDFNNILTVIMGTAQLLQHDMIDESTRESLSEIIKASNRAAGLTRQLLAFSKKQLLKPKFVNLNRVLQEMENMLRRILPENIQLDIQFHNQPITIKVDKVQLEQVLLNLVINAKEAMPDGGDLRITSFVNSKHIGNQLRYYGSLSIEDTGVGMNEQTKLRLFEPFFTTKAKGTGLGLATVYGIIAQSNGEIEVDSNVGKGSKFLINFPLSLNVVNEEEEPIIKKSEWKGTETILLIEDEDAVRRIVKQILTNEGYSVWEAENGESAILNYSHLVDKIDLIVSDVIMPVMGGVEVVSKFHEMDPSKKVLFISGYAGDENAVKDHDAFITKPIERVQLLKKIREILG